MMAVIRAFENTEYTLVNAELENTKRLNSFEHLNDYKTGWNKLAEVISGQRIFVLTKNVSDSFKTLQIFLAFKRNDRKAILIAMQNTVGANQHKNAVRKLLEIADRQPFKISIC
uniref:Uncharacterized protein n=1 Tax=Onchocerca volvulus TaxID=6282 RepID=A0A8R1TT26_ONCVO